MREIRVARAIILGEDKRILLGKRAEGIGAGLMELPGGKVDPGEKPRAAVVREVKEELEITFEPIDLFRKYKDRGADGTVFENYIFWGPANGTPRPNPKEVSSADHFSREALETLLFAFNHGDHIRDFYDWYEGETGIILPRKPSGDQR